MISAALARREFPHRFLMNAALHLTPGRRLKCRLTNSRMGVPRQQLPAAAVRSIG
jgi:hypothetical protein